MQTALMIIDMQNGMKRDRNPPSNHPSAEGNIALLLDHWRGQAWPVVHVAHSSVSPDSSFLAGTDLVLFQAAFEPRDDEYIAHKTVPSAFSDQSLEAWLVDRDVHRLVIAGVSTNISIEGTARSASDLGFDVTVVTDATFAFQRPDLTGKLREAEEWHVMSLSNLQAEYARLAMTAEFLA